MTADPEREALLPCPFCGGEAERFDLDDLPEDDPNVGASGIQCKRCGASSPLHFDRKENLDSSWNRRAAGWMPRPEPGSTDSVIAAFRIAAEVIAADEDRLRKLRVFADYWPTIEAYAPPPEVAEDVSEIVQAMVALADATRVALNPGDSDAD